MSAEKEKNSSLHLLMDEAGESSDDESFDGNVSGDDGSESSGGSDSGSDDEGEDVSDDEGEDVNDDDSEEASTSKASKPRSKRSMFLQDEAEEDSEEEGSRKKRKRKSSGNEDEEDDDDDNEEDDGDLEDLIADSEESEEDSDGEVKHKRRKLSRIQRGSKRAHTEELRNELAELNDDYEEEALDALPAEDDFVEEDRPAAATSERTGATSIRRLKEMIEDYEDSDDDFIEDDTGGLHRESQAGGRIHMLSAGKMQDALDIFGEDFGDLAADLADLDNEQPGTLVEQEAAPAKRIDRVFDPEAVKALYLTDADNVIRETDIPERLQIRRLEELNGLQGPVTEEDYEEEAKWLCRNVLAKYSRAHKYFDDGAKDALVAVLKKVWKENVEIPFIQMYLSHLYEGVLSADDIWLVFRFERMYLAFNALRKVLKQRSTRLELPDVSYPRMIESASTVDELNDFGKFLHLVHRANAILEEDAPRKTQLRFERLLSKELTEVAASFLVKPHFFVDNLLTGFAEYRSVDPEVGPVEHLQQAGLTAPDSTDNLVWFAAYQLGNDPRLRQYLRDEFKSDATVSTHPTLIGKDKITRSHEFYDVCNIDRKPFKDMLEGRFPGQFSRMIKASKEGLIRIELNVPATDECMNRIFRASDTYYSDSTSAIGDEWNGLRKKVLTTALRDHLIPSLKQQLHAELVRTSHHQVSLLVEDACLSQLMTGPWRVDYNNDNIARSPGHQGEYHDDVKPVGIPSLSTQSRVMTIIMGERRRAYAVMVDTGGAFVDAFVVPNAIAFGHARAKTIEEFKRFIQRHFPDAIGIAAESVDSDDLYWIVKDAADAAYHEQKSITRKGDVHSIPLHFVRPALAKVMASSKLVARWHANTLLKSQPPEVLAGLMMGLYMQDPLATSCCLWNDVDVDLPLAVVWDPMQSFLSKQELRRVLEHCFVRAVNEVGIDVNRVLRSPSSRHLQYVFQFICGLGPRKASNLLHLSYLPALSMLRGGGDDDAAELYGPTVYRNMVGFLRVHTDDARADTIGDLMDSTRLHPDHEEALRKVAGGFLDEDVELSDDMLKAAIAQLMGDAPRLKHMRVEGFATLVFGNDYTRENENTLKMIKSELSNPFQEVRKPYEAPNKWEAFELITGETTTSLAPGMWVVAKVRRSRDSHNYECDIKNGIRAIADKKQLQMLAEHRFPNEIQDGDRGPRIDVYGKTFALRIRGVDIDGRLVVLSAHEEDMNKEQWEEPQQRPGLPGLDPSLITASTAVTDKYGARDAGVLTSRERQDLQKKVQRSVGRTIEHPLFKNLPYHDAIQYLKDRPRGEILIRPSSRGLNNITISIKFFGDLIMHVTVDEFEKSNPTALGNVLKIDDRQYEDLDEILKRHVLEMVRLWNDVFNHRKFKEDSVDVIISDLKEERKHISYAAYAIGVDNKRPGHFIFYYCNQAGGGVQKERITVTPNGFTFCEQQGLPSMGRLISWFKKNYKAYRQGRSGGHRSSQGFEGGAWGGSAVGTGTSSSSAWDQPASASYGSDHHTSTTATSGWSGSYYG